jgi:hypothetical protein
MIKIDALTVQFGGIKPLDALEAQFSAAILIMMRAVPETCCRDVRRGA